MVDTVTSLAARVHELLVALLTHGAAAVVPGHDVSSSPARPLHHDPRFRALYPRTHFTAADLDEYFWLHQEMQTMSRDAERATFDNAGRLDTGVSLLPQAPIGAHRSTV
ncbi:hypothetical protein [Streptomyces sp. NPDC057686]|uniref:hypothetical protein n=1 Tax=Streptomyces sp. NPDC057686 TaxID=3346212 RepID=UPI00368E4597